MARGKIESGAVDRRRSRFSDEGAFEVWRIRSDGVGGDGHLSIVESDPAVRAPSAPTAFGASIRAFGRQTFAPDFPRGAGTRPMDVLTLTFRTVKHSEYEG